MNLLMKSSIPIRQRDGVSDDKNVEKRTLQHQECKLRYSYGKRREVPQNIKEFHVDGTIHFCRSSGEIESLSLLCIHLISSVLFTTAEAFETT